jgi:hypothetical protein
MVSLEEISTRLREISCPICKKSEFMINPQSSHSFAEEIYTARCNGCNYTFQVSSPTKPISQTDPDIAIWLKGLSCPKCLENGVEFNFRCVPSVRECYYFVTCKACGRPFREKAPMEAFE